MTSKEANSRIKINKMLEDSGWRFFDSAEGKANIQLEPNVKITQRQIDAWGNDFEKTSSGFIDFLLLDDKGFPLVVLEAKREKINPLFAKEQARAYAKGYDVRFVILSNGESHYFWDMAVGNPEVIIEFPTQASLMERTGFQPNAKSLADEIVEEDYIAISQDPNYKADPRYRDETTRNEFLWEKGLRVLRPYQLAAIHALQKAAKEGKNRFLFEMATGTGKTLVSAAVIKLFLRSGNARRVLFLVDRLELEDQANKNFIKYLENDFTTVVYKHNRDDWRKAEIVVTTVQSLSAQDNYKRLFSPTDFDLLIADESHRAIGGNSRAVFEYFVGYKLGLTATPKDYLKNIDGNDLSVVDPRAWEKRQLLDTYATFGCESGDPTYRYSLIDGVREGYLINPVVADARTEITTELLSQEGYAVRMENEEGDEEEMIFRHRDFERKFFSEKTNVVFCDTFLKHAILDPISHEIGKSIVFCVSQDHAAKITQILNVMAMKVWPGKYESDFAMQVTSVVADAQQATINFANNNLNGRTRWKEDYKSSRTRVCVTVGMMTTGYDCSDVLNLALMRPIFSPTDFVQIKGRGTRKHTFNYMNANDEKISHEKGSFKLFDFFANCEYFEENYNYDEVLKLPKQGGFNIAEDKNSYVTPDGWESFNPDQVATYTEEKVGEDGMRIDRELFEKAREVLFQDVDLRSAVENEMWDFAVRIFQERYENKPTMFLTLDKLRKSENLDRRLTWREFLARVFGLIDGFESKDALLEKECQKFIAIHKPKSEYIPLIKNFIKAYVTNEYFRNEINQNRYPYDYAGFTKQEYSALNGWRDILPNYILDYIPLNTYL